MKTIIQALKEITTADQKQKHDKMYKENYWYKAWYDTTCDMANLKNKLEGMSRTIYIYLDDYEPLPESLNQDWDGYVLVREDSIKRLLKEGKEAETLTKALKE